MVIDKFVSVDEADELVDNLYLPDSAECREWGMLGVEQKSIILGRATAKIDKLMFKGVKAEKTALSFPRILNGVRVEIPFEIKIATVMQALRSYIESKTEYVKMQELGVKSYSVEGASISFNAGSKTKNRDGIYTEVFEDYLRKWCY